MSIDKDCSASNGAEVVRQRELFIEACALMDKARAEIERLRTRNALLEGVAKEFMDMFIPAIDKTGRWIDFCDPCSSQCEDMPNLTAYMKEVSG